MSADLEVLLNDLVMKAERANAAFNRELANSELVARAAERMRQLNEQAFNEALSVMRPLQSLDGIGHQPVPQSLPTFPPAWN